MSQTEPQEVRTSSMYLVLLSAMVLDRLFDLRNADRDPVISADEVMKMRAAAQEEASKRLLVDARLCRNKSGIDPDMEWKMLRELLSELKQRALKRHCKDKKLIDDDRLNEVADGLYFERAFPGGTGGEQLNAYIEEGDRGTILDEFSHILFDINK